MKTHLPYVAFDESELLQFRKHAALPLLLHPAKHINPYDSLLLLSKKTRSDWALIELTRHAFSQEENLQINCAILDTLHRHNCRPMLVGGHWEDGSRERFFCIVREQKQSMEEFKTWVTACVTADTSGNTHAVVHMGSLIRDEAHGLKPITEAHFNQENSLVHPDGSWQPFAETHFGDLYTYEIKRDKRTFVFDGVEEPIGTEECELFEQAGIAYPSIRICRF